MSVLLAEPDFRLRRRQGQVRATFRGKSAAAVARLELHSGDAVTLDLQGVQWVEEDLRGFTPGRGIEWGMVFDKRLALKVRRMKSE